MNPWRLVEADVAGAARVEEPSSRPQLVRARRVDLCGEWGFRHDDAEVGLRERWFDEEVPFDRTIVVPFPPESTASGIGDDGVHDVVWYRRELTAEAVEATGFGVGGRLVLHFAAVDYRCSVWLNGRLVGSHEGGHTPFSMELQDVLRTDGPQLLTVRCEDRAADVEQPRGKQDWRRDPHVVWYRRTTGIWQPVWLEATPELAVERVHWTSSLTEATVRAEIALTGVPAAGVECEITLSHAGEVLGSVRFPLRGQRSAATVALPGQANGQAYEELLWSPESPTLVDAVVRLVGTGGGDEVGSYVGLRSAAVGGGRFLLNDRPRFVRSVLSQGYWPDSHLAAPDGPALRREVETILALGFDAVRLHQKVEDPRLLYWADRLGLMVWGEAAAAYAFSSTSVARTTGEWLEVLERDRSHPSIITWVPHNESWGVQHISHDPRQASFVRGLAELTRAIDGTRPVISNDGWEHVGSDILSVHDYDVDPQALAERYGGADVRARLAQGFGPAGRRLSVAGDPGDTHGIDDEAPLMLTEFGGISFALDGAAPADAWGYSDVGSADELEERLRALYVALRGCPELAGTCYTQLTDTEQETNGLLTADRVPKLDPAVIRSIVAG